jgi:hypothetical protein
MNFKLGVFFAVALCVSPGASAIDSGDFRVELSTRLERVEVPLNETVRLFVEVGWDGPAGAVEVLDVSPPVLSNLEQTGNAVSVRQQTGENGPETIRTVTYILRPQSLGMAYVEPLNLKYRLGDSTKELSAATERIELKVTGPVRHLTIPGSAIWAVIVLMALILGAVALIRRRRGKSPEEPPDEQIAHPRLNALARLGRISGDDRAEAASQIVETLTAFAVEELALEPETGTGLPRSASDRLPPETAERLKQFFLRLDRARFGGETAGDGETAELINAARDLVDDISAAARQDNETETLQPEQSDS